MDKIKTFVVEKIFSVPTVTALMIGVGVSFLVWDKWGLFSIFWGVAVAIVIWIMADILEATTSRGRQD